VAELELSIPCKSAPCKYGMATMAILMPVWAITIPFCLGLFTSMVLKESNHFLPLQTFVIFSTLLSIPLISVVLAAIFEDDVIVVSKEGIAFPLRMLPALGFRRERHWSDLLSVSMNLSDGSSTSRPKGTVGLFFKSGGSALVKLDTLSPSDLEQMLLAIEVWGINCQRSEALIEFQTTLQNESRGVETLSYTKMWEEELSRRFAGTSFVPLEPGALLQNGRIKIIRQLAFGGLSAIYLVQRNEIEMLVLKEAVIPANAEPESRAKAEELFDREARFLLRLDHPQIAKVHDYFQESGRSYLLLDYIRGQDLRQLVKQNGAQPVEKVLEWGEQIISIVEYLHSQSPPIIHRDLTPDNLVLDHDGRVIMIDFGAANEFVGTATGTLVGKQAYIAPEQLRGKAELRSDLYAFGGTLQFLLTGSDPEALSVSHPAETNKEVSEELDQLVASTTDMEVEGRPENAQAVASKLHEIKAKHVPAPKPAAETT